MSVPALIGSIGSTEDSMRQADLQLRALGATFKLLDEKRRDPDRRGDHYLDPAWLDVARQIIALPASTRNSLRLKARIMLALIEATGATELAIDAARSLAADLEIPERMRPH